MVCRRYSRAFLHPLAAKGLPFATNLITYHNIAYMMVRGAGGWLMFVPGDGRVCQGMAMFERGWGCVCQGLGPCL